MLAFTVGLLIYPTEQGETLVWKLMSRLSRGQQIYDMAIPMFPAMKNVF